MNLVPLQIDEKHDEVALLEAGTHVRMRGGYHIASDAREKAVKVFFRHEDDTDWERLHEEPASMDRAEKWATDNGHTVWIGGMFIGPASKELLELQADLP